MAAMDHAGDAGPRMVEQAKAGDLTALRDEVTAFMRKEGQSFFATHIGQAMLRMAAAGAAREGQVHVLKYFCEEWMLNPNPQPASPWNAIKSLLLCAIDNNRDEAAMYLLDLPDHPGFSSLELYLDDINPDTHFTMLQELAKKGKLDLIEKVVARGADIHAHAEDTYLPLRYALDHGHADVAGYLLEVYKGSGRSAEALQTINWVLRGEPLPLLIYIMLEAPMSAVDTLHIIKHVVEAGENPLAIHTLQRVLAGYDSKDENP